MGCSSRWTCLMWCARAGCARWRRTKTLPRRASWTRLRDLCSASSTSRWERPALTKESFSISRNAKCGGCDEERRWFYSQTLFSDRQASWQLRWPLRRLMMSQSAEADELFLCCWPLQRPSRSDSLVLQQGCSLWAENTQSIHIARFWFLGAGERLFPILLSSLDCRCVILVDSMHLRVGNAPIHLCGNRRRICIMNVGFFSPSGRTSL